MRLGRGDEVQAEALVRDIGGYARLLDLAAASSGRTLNRHALSRDASVSYETARRYLDVLEDTLILFRIPAWSGSDRASLGGVGAAAARRHDLARGTVQPFRTLVAHRKGLLFDLGVRNAMPRRPLDRPLDDERGLLLLSVGREVWAIAVKASPRVDGRDLKGLEAFADRAGRVARRIVVFLGARRQRIDGVDVLPLEAFLGELPG